MPFFEDTAHFDINDSVFTDVGHDQTIVSDSIVADVGHNYNISNSIIISNYNVSINPVSDYHRPGTAESPPSSKTSSSEIIFRPTFRSAAIDSHLIASRLIVSIVQSLMALSSSDRFRDLKEDLNTLQQTVDLSGLAIKAYQGTPLGRILTRTISEETAQCSGVLRDFLNAMKGYQRDVSQRACFFPSVERWEVGVNLAK
jgi:hypothetical protein